MLKFNGKLIVARVLLSLLFVSGNPTSRAFSDEDFCNLLFSAKSVDQENSVRIIQGITELSSAILHGEFTLSTVETEDTDDVSANLRKHLELLHRFQQARASEEQEMRNEIFSLKKQNATFKQAAKNEYNNLSIEYKKMQEEFKKAAQRCKFLENENETSKKQLEEYKLSAQKAKSQEENSNLIQEMSEQINTLRTENSNLTQKIDNLEKQNESEEIANLKLKLENGFQKYENLSQENKELRDSYNQMKTNVEKNMNHYKTELQEIKNEYKEWASKSDELFASFSTESMKDDETNRLKFLFLQHLVGVPQKSIEGRFEMVDKEFENAIDNIFENEFGTFEIFFDEELN